MKTIKDYCSHLRTWTKRKLGSSQTRMFAALLLFSFLAVICAEPSFAQGIKTTNTPSFEVEIIGIVAGFGTTFSSLPDLVVMLRRRSTQGISPRMAGICAVFQCLWLLYGFLLPSPSLIFWNIIAITMNSTTVTTYFYLTKINANTSK